MAKTNFSGDNIGRSRAERQEIETTPNGTFQELT